MLPFVLTSVLILGILGLCVYSAATFWKNERRITHEEHLTPALKARGLKFVASRAPFFAVHPRDKRLKIGVLGTDLDTWQGKRSVPRVVTFEDTDCHRMEAVAWLDFDRSGLTGIRWRPELTEQLDPLPPEELIAKNERRE